MCTFLLVRRCDSLEIDIRQVYSGSSIGEYEVYWNKWHDLSRSCVLSSKHAMSCNDCLMSFKDDTTDVTASYIFVYRSMCLINSG